MSVSLITASFDNEVVYLLAHRLNRRGIFFNQTSLNILAPIFINGSVCDPKVSEQHLNNLIQYGTQNGFNHETIVGHTRLERQRSKAVPTLKNLGNPFTLDQHILTIQLHPEKFKKDKAEDLAIHIELNADDNKNRIISITPAMEALLAELKKKYNLTQNTSINQN